MSHVQPPLLSALDGGRSRSPEQNDAEWLAAMARIAEACEQGLIQDLHPLHPRRAELQVVTRDARQAARLPAASRLQSA